jgi:hypothetical protein
MTDRSRLCKSPDDFFGLNGSVVMRLSPDAAIGVCERAASERVVISRIEGGIWLNPGFESRLDCIWDGADPPLAQEAAHTNNLLALDFIKSQAATHSAFILTAPPMSGWARNGSDCVL